MKRYILITTVLTLAFCAAVALFNYRVDPYIIYHFEDANEESLNRIEQFHHLRLTKPWLIQQTKPSAVIAGTSRSAAVYPQHPTWPKDHSYNLSIPGQTIYEMLRSIEHAQANGPLKKLMIGLDFELFIVPEPRFNPGFKESRLAHNAEDLISPGFYWQRLNDIRDTLFSMDGLARSLTALTGTANGGARYNRYYRNGAWTINDSAYSTGYMGYIVVGRENVLGQRTRQLDLDANLKIFADILRFAHQQNIETRLFITPGHIFVVDLWARIGYSQLWHEFHRGLVAVNKAVAEEMGVEPFPLFGFNQVQGVVDEPIREFRKDNQSVFTDGLHFRPVLGKRIMEDVWTDGSNAGVKLDSDSIEQYLSQVEKLRHQFERDNAKVTTLLRRHISPELD